MVDVSRASLLARASSGVPQASNGRRSAGRRHRADATAQFGLAQRTARIAGYEVLVWDRDLLPAITRGFARGCGPKWQP